MRRSFDAVHMSFGVIYHTSLVLVSVDMQIKFDMPSFTYFTDMTEAQK